MKVPAASVQLRAAPKDGTVKDPDRGANAPKGGAAGGGDDERPAAQQSRGTADPDGSGRPARSGRHARRAKPRHAKPQRAKNPQPAMSRPEGETQTRDPAETRQPKKRRKRRRGRKVFARDGAAQPAQAQQVGAAQPPRDTHGRGGRDEEARGQEARGQEARGQEARGQEARGAVRPEAVRPADRAAGVAPAFAPNRYGAHGGSLRSGQLPVYAALDLGTNNCRLLVAVPGRPGQFRVIDAFSRIVRLGEGLASSGRLGERAMDRAVEALKVCADKLGNRKVRKARLIATEACRAAENGAEFLARVEDEAGLKLEIIDRKTEARLAVSGCGPLVERGTDAVVLFDIGGGSSEIALVDISRHRTPRLANHIVSWTSLPVGVVSLAERFGGRHVTPAVFEAMVGEVARLLDGFEGRGKLAHLASGAGFHLLGTSGTVTTLAGVHLGLERYDRRRVDGLWMDNANVDAMIARLLSWDFEQRVANPCIGADRADLVLAGCAILEAIRRHWPSERLRVADRGLREGMLSELMADDGVWRRNRRDARGNMPGEVFSR